MREREDVEQALEQHGDAVWRACSLYFWDDADKQDAFQETFLKFALHDGSFRDEEHRKAWLLRVASNVCKDMLKAASRKNVSLDGSEGFPEPRATDVRSQPGSEESEVLEIMLSLDDPPRTPVYLALYEGYSAPEISKMLDAPVNTVYSWISRGRKMLKEALSR